ncbi:HD domain-containing protein [Candidatus Micrarchaeota archaeon]|nr:HD domain-containing protein [Candidatus Micrarchaeota archaeon]
MIFVKDVEAIVRNKLKNQPKQSLAHDFNHFCRVRKNALKIAKHYSIVDLEVLQLACLLHDVDQPFDAKREHVEKSISLAREILSSINYPRIERVIEVMSQHSTEKLSEKTSLEAKILFDADKLDGLGPIGVARVFALCGQQGKTIPQAIAWYEKKIEVALSDLQTPEGKKLIEKELVYTRRYLEELKSVFS